MGVSTFAHPCCQAFALPLSKDKQRSQPTPSDYKYNYWLNHSNSWDIINPRKRLSLHYLCGDSKVRSLTAQNDNVRKRLFEAGPTNGLEASFHRFIDPPCRKRLA